MHIKRLALLYFISDIALLAVAVFLSFVIKAKGFGYFASYRWYFVIFLLSWLLASIVTRKHQINEDNYRRSLVKLAHTALIDIGLLSFIVYVFTGYRDLSRFIIYGSILFTALFDLVAVSGLHLLKGFQFVSEPKLRDENRTIFDIEGGKNGAALSEQHLPELPPLEDGEVPLSETFDNGFLGDNDQLREFLQAHLNLDRISKDRAEMLSTETYFNITRYEPHSLQLFINDHKVNDLKDIDKFFSRINENLEWGGYFVGKGITIAEKYKKIMESYPPPINHIIYYLDFLFTRAMPKFASLRGAYCLITRGKNKAISKAEILGRLRYSGFKPVALEVIDGYLYFIARKGDKPIQNGQPSYGLLIKLERVGKDGKLFNLYKFRTMHPYSEFIQDYVYEENHLDKSGKLKDDFRITTWGKFLRKFYIDELPQFYNIYKGDIRLVGVRALSQHYFDLYPEDMKRKRVKYKPGLVPPYYVDLPQGLDAIIESERKYLSDKDKGLRTTDLKYFLRAWRNILFRRSLLPRR